jgi:hypothetical protein
MENAQRTHILVDCGMIRFWRIVSFISLCVAVLIFYKYGYHFGGYFFLLPVIVWVPLTENPFGWRCFEPRGAASIRFELQSIQAEISANNPNPGKMKRHLDTIEKYVDFYSLDLPPWMEEKLSSARQYL